MKFYILVFIIAVISDFASALKKSHHGKAHQHAHVTDGTPSPNTGLNPHEDAQKAHMTSQNNRKHDFQSDGPATPVTSQGVNPAVAAPSPTTKKNILQATAEEHNINKKQLDDQNGIPMETENLIHVTPKSPTQKKGKKSQGQRKRSQNSPEGGKQRKSSKNASEAGEDHQNKQKLNKNTNAGVKRSGKKANKNRKYPKKYNAQKHNSKKAQKEKKTLEKNKEKRDKLKDKKEKKNKLKTHDNV